MHLATTAGLNVALPAMARDFDTGIGTVIWVQVAYGIALAAGTIPVGQISRAVNPRRFVLMANALTIVLELAIAFAPSIFVVIVARALESIARSVPWLVLQVVAIGGFRPEQRGKVLGLTRLVQGVALTISPALTGFVTEQWGWRWMFAASALAFGAIQVGLMLWFPEVEAETAGDESSFTLARLDVRGACLLGAGLTAVLSAVQLRAGSETQTVGTVMAAAGIGALGLFVLAELRSPWPMLPMSIFRVPGVAIASVQAVFLGVVNGALPVLFPLLFITGYGWSAAFAGAVLLFLNIARVPAAPVAGWAADRFGAARVLLLATAISVAGQLMAATLGFAPAVALVVVCLTLTGLGQGLVTVANLKQIFSAMPAEHLHLAPATNIVLLQLGTAAGQAFVAAAYQVAGLGGRTAGPNQTAVSVSSGSILALTAVFGAGMLLAQLGPLFKRGRTAPGLIS